LWNCIYSELTELTQCLGEMQEVRHCKERKPLVMWTCYMPHLASRNISEELQTVFQAVITVVNYVKNGQLRGRLFAKLCYDV